MVEEFFGPDTFYIENYTVLFAAPYLADQYRDSCMKCIVMYNCLPLVFGETLEVIQLNWSVMNIQFKLHQTKHYLQLLPGPAVGGNINKHCILSVC